MDKRCLLPFDLDKALKGAKVVTRISKVVSNLTHFSMVEKDFSLVGVVDTKLMIFTSEGYYLGNQTESINDLFIVSTLKEYYVVLFRKLGCVNICTTNTMSKKDADD